MNEEIQQWYSVREAATYLGIPWRTMQRYAQRGLIQTTQVTGYRNHQEYRIARADLDAFVPPPMGRKPKPRSGRANRREDGGIVWDGIHYPTLVALAEAKDVTRAAVWLWKQRGYAGDADIKPIGRPRKTAGERIVGGCVVSKPMSENQHLRELAREMAEAIIGGQFGYDGDCQFCSEYIWTNENKHAPACIVLKARALLEEMDKDSDHDVLPD